MFGPEGHPQHCCAWLGVASSFPNCASSTVPEEVNKIGRDSISYVESLIESIMGGLEGLINILDAEGGFGSLEIQLTPDQAAIRMLHGIKISISSIKSAKVIPGVLVPGLESYPENSNSVKMLEAAVQRLTNLCSVLNDMEPICVLNHVFVLREYMRECILGNFRRRLLSILKTDNGLERPSTIESLIRRHISIIHLAEQHISMDLTTGIREILLSETFSGPVHSLQTFEKSTSQPTGSAIEVVCNWYIEHIVKDVSTAEVIFSPLHNCFKSSQLIGGYFADSFTSTEELKSLFRAFGGYGFDKFDRMMREHMAALLSCIEATLLSNSEVLEAFAGSMSSPDRLEREKSFKQIVEMESVVGFCIQAGQAIAFHRLLVESAGAVLEENAPLIVTLVSSVKSQLPDEIPEKDEIRRLRSVAIDAGETVELDTEWVHSIMAERGSFDNGSWSLLPYLCASFMVSSVWNTTYFDVNIGGFNSNVQCLARCISAVIAASEFIRSEKSELQRQSLSNGHGSEMEPETLTRTSVQANIKSAMQMYVKYSAGIILSSFTESNRTHLVPKLTFLDHLCHISPYLPRSALELHLPYTLLRSIYHQSNGNPPPASLDILCPSPRQSPHISLAHNSPRLRQNHSDLAQSSFQDYPGYHAAQGYRREATILYDVDGAARRAEERQHRRQGAPADGGMGRKVKFVDGAASGSRGGLSPLPRFAVSRSSPAPNK